MAEAKVCVYKCGHRPCHEFGKERERVERRIPISTWSEPRALMRSTATMPGLEYCQSCGYVMVFVRDVK